jgi:hypothetical protein
MSRSATVREKFFADPLYQVYKPLIEFFFISSSVPSVCFISIIVAVS